MSKFKTITHILCLVLTGLLLVFVAVAWYATNKQASVTGGVGSTKGNKKVYISETYDGTTALTTDNYVANGFKDHVTISMENDYLTPASSSNGINFFAAASFNASGVAQTFKAVSSGYYFVEKEYYVLTTEEEDVTIYLDQLTINATSNGGSIYKAVRVSLNHDEAGTTNDYSLMVKQSEQDSLSPVSGISTTATDTAVSSDSLSDSVASLTLASSNSGALTAYLITFRVWIEGQSSYAVAANAGAAFTVNFRFKAVGD